MKTNRERIEELCSEIDRLHKLGVHWTRIDQLCKQLADLQAIEYREDN